MQLFLLVSSLLTLGLQFNAEVFIYLQSLILQQPWRILTAHWVHVGWIHCVMNLLALWCLPLIFPEVKTKQLLVASIVLPIFLSLNFYLIYPNLHGYAGFSGVLHGLYTLAGLNSLKHFKTGKFALIVLIGIIFKLLGEVYWSEYSMTAQLIGHAVFIQAHQWGAVFGAMLYLIFQQSNQHTLLTK